MSKTRVGFRFLMGVCCLLILMGPKASAETEEERRERVERTEQMKRTEEVTGVTSRMWSKISKKLGWYVDYGGTARDTHTGGDEGDRNYASPDSQEFSKDYELNTFLNLTDLRRVSKFYTRLRTTYTERKKNSATTKGNEWTELEVDALYYERKYVGGPTRTTLTLGRQSVSVGRGIAYSATADGVQTSTTLAKGQIVLFAVRADRSPDDADPGNLSPPSRGRTKRDFFGAEMKWNWGQYLNPYYYYVENNDRSRNEIDPFSSATQIDANLTHIYEPTFYGIGANGSITPRLSYFAEFIRVQGTTTSVGNRGDTTTVQSRAYDAGLKYRYASVYQPTFSIEWAYGSGDPDRQSTVNSTLYGNTANADMAFRPFGGLGLGYALAPTLANIKVRKYSASFMPFTQARLERPRKIRVTVDYYKYRKDQDAGPTSDFDIPSDQFSKKEIGRELNAELSWKIYTDLSLNVRWGKFAPGSGYDIFANGVQTRTRAVPEIYWRFQWSLDI